MGFTFQYVWIFKGLRFFSINKRRKRVKFKIPDSFKKWFVDHWLLEIIIPWRLWKFTLTKDHDSFISPMGPCWRPKKPYKVAEGN